MSAQLVRFPKRPRRAQRSCFRPGDRAKVVAPWLLPFFSGEVQLKRAAPCKLSGRGALWWDFTETVTVRLGELCTMDIPGLPEGDLQLIERARNEALIIPLNRRVKR